MAFEENSDGGAAGSAADILGGGAPAGEGTGSGDGGAGEPNPNGGQPPLDGVDPDWYQNLSADPLEGDAPSHRDYVKAKGWKSQDDIIKSYREAERAIRDSGRIKVPGEGATPEDIASFHKAIGVPDSPDGYEFTPPVGDDGEPLPLDMNLLNPLAKAAHERGLPKAAFEGLVSDFIQLQLDQAASIDSTAQAEAQRVVKGWGADAEEKKAAIDRAAAALKISGQQLVAMRNSLGAEFTLNMMARLGAGLGEDVLLAGERQRFGVTASEAQAELDRMKADKDMAAKAMLPGTPENIRWKRLSDAVAANAQRAAQGG